MSGIKKDYKPLDRHYTSLLLNNAMSGLQQPINLTIPSIKCIPTIWVILSRFPIWETFIQLLFNY